MFFLGDKKSRGRFACHDTLACHDILGKNFREKEYVFVLVAKNFREKELTIYNNIIHSPLDPANPEKFPLLMTRIQASNVNKLDVRRYLKTWTQTAGQRILSSIRAVLMDDKHQWGEAFRLNGSDCLVDRTQLSFVHLLSEKPLERTIFLSLRRDV